MKKVIYFFLVLSCISLTPASAQGGRIDSFSVIPSQPRTGDSVMVLAHCWFPYSGCRLQFSTLNQQNLFAEAIHCTGMLTAICHRTDTFRLAPRQPGNYTLRFNLLTGSEPDCNSFTNRLDSVSFTVAGQPPTSINEQTSGKSVFTAHYQHGRLLIWSLPADSRPFELRLVSLDGRLAGRHYNCRVGDPIPMDLRAGLYVVSMIRGQSLVTQRLFVE